MQIRLFRRDDQARARAIIEGGLRERWGADYDPSFNVDTHDLWGSYMVDGRELFVVADDGTIVGTGALIPEATGTGRIVRMSVDRRTRRRGIGLTLTSFLIDRARSRGWHQLHVLTDTPWIEAVNLYHAAGFTLVDADETDTRFAMIL